MRRIAGLVFLGAVLLTASCGGSGAPVRPTSPPTVTDLQTTPLPPSLVKVAEDVARLRGLPPPLGVRFGFVPRSAVPALIDRLLSDEERARFAERTTLYRLLGHFRSDEDYLSVYRQLGRSSVAGLYSPRERTLWVVQDGNAPPNLDTLPRETMSALAHELVHATQDAAFNLKTLGAGAGLDASLALSCLIEGDAVTHQGLYEAKYLLEAGGRGPVVATYPADLPPSLSREFFFPYTTCAEWARSIREAGGTAAVDALFRSPPTSTAVVLHPERGQDWRPAEVRLPDLARGLGGGWKRESGGTFGEFEVRNYLQLRLPGLQASTAAAGWQGDRYDVYTQNNEQVAVFRLVFSDANQAGQFRAAQDALLRATGAAATVASGVLIASRPDGNTTARLETSGREVLFAIGSSAGLAGRAIRLLGGG